ncbi:DUF4183 domain-containing protein [Ureibacillus thermophilus]|jgi:hypothetical protein|uniref:DUF4183 domain-containing protein n=3 Tax=Ureibacillus TaxID=160795 RepID=A0A540UUK7_9BACL|nr:DUF4183 domain-containing protein [Ureibacillus terrenus]MED3662898.1 DUF4183 domain-containing protein [Ureibacillus terrenus]MED3764094.1 DUF4183 domain-containing protein [Ureibacillus terrenus]TQE88169.1 DUF4183 domain-containing protein [Ureibacillus terrenus]
MMNKQTGVNNLPKPLLRIPPLPPTEFSFRLPKKVEVFEYFTISNGKSRVYRDQDGITKGKHHKIMDPSTVSYMNLFINGVLQPKENYEVECGMLKLITEDLPPKGAPIILQMFKF